MSPLSGGTLGLFVILAPGFFFLFFYYAIGKISREDYQYGLVFDIGAIVSASLFLHIIIGLLYFNGAATLYGFHKFWNNFFEIFINQKYDVLKSNPRFIISVLLYPFVICGVAGAAGAFIITKIEKGNREWFRSIGRHITHGAIYDAIFDKENEVATAASVLTNIQFEGKYVAYYGEVVDIIMGTGSKITSVVLAKPERRLIRFGREKFYTSNVQNKVEMEENESGTLFIPESNIINVVVIKIRSAQPDQLRA